MAGPRFERPRGDRLVVAAGDEPRPVGARADARHLAGVADVGREQGRRRVVRRLEAGAAVVVADEQARRPALAGRHERIARRERIAIPVERQPVALDDGPAGGADGVPPGDAVRIDRPAVGLAPRLDEFGEGVSGLRPGQDLERPPVAGPAAVGVGRGRVAAGLHGQRVPRRRQPDSPQPPARAADDRCRVRLGRVDQGDFVVRPAGDGQSAVGVEGQLLGPADVLQRLVQSQCVAGEVVQVDAVVAVEEELGPRDGRPDRHGQALGRGVEGDGAGEFAGLQVERAAGVAGDGPERDARPGVGGGDPRAVRRQGHGERLQRGRGRVAQIPDRVGLAGEVAGEQFAALGDAQELAVGEPEAARPVEGFRLGVVAGDAFVDADATRRLVVEGPNPERAVGRAERGRLAVGRERGGHDGVKVLARLGRRHGRGERVAGAEVDEADEAVADAEAADEQFRAVRRPGDGLDAAALLAPRRPADDARLLGVDPLGGDRPDADDLVVAGGDEMGAVAVEGEEVARPGAAAGLDEDFGLLALAPVLRTTPDAAASRTTRQRMKRLRGACPFYPAGERNVSPRREASRVSQRGDVKTSASARVKPGNSGPPGMASARP